MCVCLYIYIKPSSQDREIVVVCTMSRSHWSSSRISQLIFTLFSELEAASYRLTDCRQHPPASPAAEEWTACPPSWKLFHSWLAASVQKYALSG